MDVLSILPNQYIIGKFYQVLWCFGETFYKNLYLFELFPRWNVYLTIKYVLDFELERPTFANSLETQYLLQIKTKLFADLPKTS